jgi:hypothetical protein
MIRLRSARARLRRVKGGPEVSRRWAVMGILVVGCGGSPAQTTSPEGDTWDAAASKRDKNGVGAPGDDGRVVAPGATGQAGRQWSKYSHQEGAFSAHVPCTAPTESTESMSNGGMTRRSHIFECPYIDGAAVYVVEYSAWDLPPQLLG